MRIKLDKQYKTIGEYHQAVKGYLDEFIEKPSRVSNRGEMILKVIQSNLYFKGGVLDIGTQYSENSDKKYAKHLYRLAYLVKDGKARHFSCLDKGEQDEILSLIGMNLEEGSEYDKRRRTIVIQYFNKRRV